MLNTNKHWEAGYIGEEFFADPEKDRLHKCMVVEQAITDGYFSFDEALGAYEMDREEYEQYIARKSSDVIIYSISGTTFIEAKTPQPAYFEIFAKMLKNWSDSNDLTNSSDFNDKMDRKLKRIERQLLGISKDIERLSTDIKEKA